MNILKRPLFLIGATITLCISSCGKTDVEPEPGDERPVPVEEEALAFPGAEGFGRHVTGGRGGKVFYVTKLTDDRSEGTLRYAIEQSGPRYILFNVSGTIELTSRLTIRNGDLTIAGQTAPGDGITLRNYSAFIDADNVIIRYLRFRMGDEAKQEDDALWSRRHKNIILDHCSISWSTDECGSFYDNENFTLQWCILSESLRNSVHDKGTHGYGGIWGGQKASFHHNILAHHDSRNPRFCGSRYTAKPELELVDFRNNVIYNWGSNSIYAGEGGKYNIINNYFKPGPATKSGVRTRIFQPYPDDGSNSQPAGVWGMFHIEGNTMYGSDIVTNDNWQGVHPKPSKPASELKSETGFDHGGITTHTAAEAYDLVLAKAGASHVRDEVDERIAREIKEGTFTYNGSNGSVNGIIDSQADAGGWPVLQTAEPPVDTSGDGMPDDWKTLHKLDPLKYEANGKDLSTAYDNVEVYMNSLVK